MTDIERDISRLERYIETLRGEINNLSSVISTMKHAQAATEARVAALEVAVSSPGPHDMNHELAPPAPEK